MQTLTATEFKAKCLKLLEQLSPEGIIVTKRGKPIARVLPFTKVSLDEFYGCMGDDVTVMGDTLTTGIRWDAES
jgi:prevent-host-death family protein